AVNKSKQVTLDSAISTDRKLADELRLRRTEVACQAMCEGGDAAVVAKAMIYNGRLFNLSNGGLELITFLRSKECQGTRGLGAVYCGPVLRHSAGAIQAANFRSAVAF
ncbi:MAG: hypothetical protein ACXW3S_15515, partial [Rhodoplanes sp.]